MNLINNNPITNNDIKLVENIFEPDISTIKSKTTRRRPLPLIDDYIEISRALVQNQQNVTLAIDGFYSRKKYGNLENSNQICSHCI